LRMSFMFATLRSAQRGEAGARIPIIAVPVSGPAAFVVQVAAAEPGLPDVPLGRAEHVISGTVTPFANWAKLVAFIEKVLVDLDPNPTFFAHLAQLELDAVNAYLIAHAIPVTQANRNVVYQYGRSDLRNAIRAIMFANLLAIIQKAPPAAGCVEGTCRTTHEQ